MYWCLEQTGTEEIEITDAENLSAYESYWSGFLWYQNLSKTEKDGAKERETNNLSIKPTCNIYLQMEQQMEIFFTYHIRQLFCVFCFANTIAPHEQWNRYQLATSQRTSGFAFVVMLLILIVFSIIFWSFSNELLFCG